MKPQPLKVIVERDCGWCLGTGYRESPAARFLRMPLDARCLNCEGGGKVYVTDHPVAGEIEVEVRA